MLTWISVTDPKRGLEGGLSVPGHVQGMSLVPPDHPEGGRGKELY